MCGIATGAARMPARGLRRLAGLAGLALAILYVLGTSPAEARDKLVIGMTQYPSTLNPNIDSMLAKSYLLGLTQRPFTVYDADWKLTCLLCTELPTFENGGAVREPLPDGKEGVAVTYKIQPGATWGDGTPVTTRDVLFTYEVGRDPSTGIANAELYRRILKIDVKDEKTFTLHLDRIEFTYNGLGDFDLLPEHLERAAFADPAQYRIRTKFDSDPTDPGLYFGPYRIVKVIPGAEIDLEANPTWWGKPPPVKRIVLKVIENTAALEANLLSGSIDYIAGELGLSIDQALAFEARHGSEYEIRYQPGLFFEHIDLNLEDPILADKRVRQALLLALDREAINAQLFGGKQAIADTSVSPLDKAAYAPDDASLRLRSDGGGEASRGSGLGPGRRRHPPQRGRRASSRSSSSPRPATATASSSSKCCRRTGARSASRSVSRPSPRASSSARPSPSASSRWRSSPGSPRPRTCRARRSIRA